MPYCKCVECGYEIDVPYTNQKCPKCNKGIMEESKNDKFRCKEFGYPNSSDACLQCPSNNECCEEWRTEKE